MAAGEISETIHLRLHNAGAGGIERVCGLARLEEGVGVLGRPANHRMVRRQRPLPMGGNVLLVHHRMEIFAGQLFDFRNLVARAEAVEEVHERDARFERRGMGDQRQIVGFLHAVRAEHGKAGLSAGIDVAVVAEDRERVSRQRARRHVHDKWGELAGDLVHVGNHQQQPLACREGGRQRACLKCPMHRAGRPALRLHLRYLRHQSPDVCFPLGRPLVGKFPHRAGRRNGINANDFREAVGHGRGCFVGVFRDHLSCNGGHSLLLRWQSS